MPTTCARTLHVQVACAECASMHSHERVSSTFRDWPVPGGAALTRRYELSRRRDVSGVGRHVEIATNASHFSDGNCEPEKWRWLDPITSVESNLIRHAELGSPGNHVNLIRRLTQILTLGAITLRFRFTNNLNDICTLA